MNLFNSNQDTQSSNILDEQDAAIVYSTSPLGGIRGQKLVGNRKREPLGAFRLSLARLFALPSDMRQLVVDQGLWIFGSASLVYAMRIGGSIACMTLGLPVGIFLLLLIISIFYMPELRMMSGLRLTAFLVGVFLTLL